MNDQRIRVKTGNEPLIPACQPSYNLLRFWAWYASDILSNTTRGAFAEYIVGTALGLSFETARDEWGSYDLNYPEPSPRLRIEVKTSAYVQSWEQVKETKPRFSIAKAQEWDKKQGKYVGATCRHADIYVFCLLAHKDPVTINPLDLNQWQFYVVSTAVLNEQFDSAATISLTALEKISTAINYSKLLDTIDTMVA